MNIIIADDEILELEKTAEAVRKALPYAKIKTFQIGEQVIEYAQSQPIDIAFLETQIRGMSGIELARRLQTIHPKINLIFVTAHNGYKSEAMDLHASGYLIKPVAESDIQAEMNCLRYIRPAECCNDKIRVYCFGNFRLLFHNVPLKFSYQKSLELAAFLIDKKGALCSYAEISAALWEDALHLPYLKKLRADMIQTFEKLGFPNIVFSQKGMLGIDPTFLCCDYYDVLNGQSDLHQLYHGEYMSQFSWADATNASLWWEVNHS